MRIRRLDRWSRIAASRNGSLGLALLVSISAAVPAAADDSPQAAPPATAPANGPPAGQNSGNPPGATDAPTPNFNDLQSPAFGDLDTPNFGQVDLPNFGNLQGPDFSDLRVPNFNDLNNPDFSDVDNPDIADVDNPEITEQDSPQVDTPDATNTNAATSNADAVNRPANQLFTSPAEASGFLGESVPLRLDLESTVLAGRASEFGLHFNTTRNRLVVASLDEGSLCEDCGLQVGDQLLAVERIWIRNYEQLSAELMEAIAGDGRAWVLVSRDGEQTWVSLDLAVGLRPTLGVNTLLHDGAVILSNVGSESAAEVAGLRVGDIILAVNGGEITSHGQLLDAVMLSAMNDGRMELVISRDGDERHLVAEVERLAIAATPGTGNDFTADSVAGRVSEELNDEGLTFAAETIDGVFDSANELLTATEGMAARTEGSVHDDAQTAAVLAREIKDAVQELDTNSAAAIQGSLGQLMSKADELDRRLTSLAIEDLGDADESLAAARESVSDLRESLDALSSSISGANGTPR